MKFPRESGILLHPTSLPGRYGIGDIGPEAYAFVDRLSWMKQHIWQILPHGETGYGDSPYQSFSTFAGNTLLISPDELMKDGLLTEVELSRYPVFSDESVDYGSVIPAKEALLATVCHHFDERATKELKDGFRAFCDDNREWLDDFGLFMALKAIHAMKPWPTWGKDLVQRKKSALEKAREKYSREIRNVELLQYLFDLQWHRLRAYCTQRGIKIVGDIPIFVAHDSADAWSHQELFYFDKNGHPTVVAGVPPDYFSATGQLWGNPLYRWEYHKKTGYQWWIRRMRKIFDMVDVVRIDHFRGFAAYWEVPGDAETAIEGRWVSGPGKDLFHALNAAFGNVPIIAEDLGVITQDVEDLRDQFEFPGMRILQFAFGNDDKAEDYRPHNYPENCVVYTGTHDNDTTVGWFNSQPGKDTTRTAEVIDQERRTVLDYVGTDGEFIHWDLIALAMRSKADTVVFPLQDLMALGSDARMNIPGTKSGNWRWRFQWDMLTENIQYTMRCLVEETGRDAT